MVLEKIFDSVFVIKGNTNIGVIFDEQKECVQIYLIDSGSSLIEAEEILLTIKNYFDSNLPNKKYKIKIIINTHSHADHCGGNAFIQTKTKCKVFAPFYECGNMETPIDQSSILWGGFPPHELKAVFFMTESLKINKKIKLDDKILLSNGKIISFLDLNGHTNNSIGIVVTLNNNKKVIFAGDSIFSKDELEKFSIPLIINHKDFLKSLKTLQENSENSVIIPGHGSFIYNDLQEIINLNEKSINSIRNTILEIVELNNFLTCEQIIKLVADSFKINLSFGQYNLISCTIKSYISILHDEHLLRLKMKENSLLICKK